jgi:hypothetical protein
MCSTPAIVWKVPMSNTSEPGTLTAVRGLDPHDIGGFLGFAEDVIASLRRPDGLYCFDRTWDSPTLRGRSVRYSIMVLIGALHRQMAGSSTTVDVDDLHRRVHDHRETLGVGDLGLLLWADARMGAPTGAATLEVLGQRSAYTAGLDRLDGMEAAWFLIGAVEALAAGLPARDVFVRALDHLQSRRSPSSPLFRHNASGRGRALLPNFATEIYSLLALTETARHGLHPGALGDARRLAEMLIELRLPDAGWPWLFQADRAVVVEPYEIYSVHQDAMAPMALFALAEVTGDAAYARIAVEGFQWCFGGNELGFQLYDVENRFAHRAIKRRGWAHSTHLWTNTVLGGALGLEARTGSAPLEVNTTCRPYHLGWILEAWSGREHLHALVPDKP